MKPFGDLQDHLQPARALEEQVHQYKQIQKAIDQQTLAAADLGRKFHEETVQQQHQMTLASKALLNSPVLGVIQRNAEFWREFQAGLRVPDLLAAHSIATKQTEEVLGAVRRLMEPWAGFNDTMNEVLRNARFLGGFTLPPARRTTGRGADAADAEAQLSDEEPSREEMLAALPEEGRAALVSVQSLPLRLLEALRRSGADLYSLSRRQFEQLIAGLVEEIGYTDVELTPQTRDRGRDIVATAHLEGGRRVSTAFEVKHPDPGGRVRVSIVRQLLGVIVHGDTLADKGIIVTSAVLTDVAWQFVVGSGDRLDGWEGEDVWDLIRQRPGRRKLP